jgi:predicted transcriptional regulator with HTH domain
MSELTQVNVTPTPSVESKEYVDSMIQKAENANKLPEDRVQETAPIKTEQPVQEKILGKFNSQDELIKSYQELEKKLGQPVDDKKVENKNPLQAQTKTDDTKSISAFQTAEKEFSETGQLSEATLTSLEKSGLPKQYINNYLKGLEAMADQFQAKAYSITQGEQQYKSMTDWVANNLTQEEINSFNQGVSSDDNTALFTIRGMYARYNAENREPKLSLGETSQSSVGDRYESIAQLKEDMKNPMYDKDPAFRKKVETKLSRSNIL